MQQLSISLGDLKALENSSRNCVTLDRGLFSHDEVCNETERLNLEKKYEQIIEETDKFSRKTVSFQANKVQTLHQWFKYREGFSAVLVEKLFSEFNVAEGETVLDPFAGACTTLLQAKQNGLNAIGIELLPHCHVNWEAKSKAFSYDLEELKTIRKLLEENTPPLSPRMFPHLAITEAAFPEDTERLITAYEDWFGTIDVSKDVKLLCRAVLMNILEDVSYTRKDGQYLRWDGRAKKITERNEIRKSQGKKAIKGIDKGTLPSVQESLKLKLDTIISDVSDLQTIKIPNPLSQQSLIEGNTLYELPKLRPNEISLVLTSPPYANRYDYTRTYALELAFLNVNQKIFSLRQSMLSCTVENKSKVKDLESFYQSVGAANRFEQVMNAVQNNKALLEIDNALQKRCERSEINNKGVPRMIKNYFLELAFVYMELFRVCKPGAYVVFVNDNVRYAGETIPVDTVSTSLAEAFGFKAQKVYVIPQRKGNSSQQMKRFGRRELRKSITVWQKPQ